MFKSLILAILASIIMSLGLVAPASAAVSGSTEYKPNPAITITLYWNSTNGQDRKVNLIKIENKSFGSPEVNVRGDNYTFKGKARANNTTTILLYPETLNSADPTFFVYIYPISTRVNGVHRIGVVSKNLALR